MALVREKDGKRLHVKSVLMGDSLVSKEFIDKLNIAPQERLYSDIAVMKIFILSAWKWTCRPA